METKKEFRYFTIFNHKKEEDYLGDMHRAGWKFTKVSGFGTYHFEKCEPADVVYQLDYNPQTKETLPQYLQMFSDCGWEYIQDYVGYSYFRKPASEMKGEEEIFNDTDSRAAMMGRVYKGRMMPLIGIFCGCLMPTFIMNIINHNYGVSAFIGGILIAYIVLFAVCASSYGNMKKK